MAKKSQNTKSKTIKNKKPNKIPAKSPKKSKKSAKKNRAPLTILIWVLVLILTGFGIYYLVQSMTPADYIFETNAFFAPFEYYEGKNIVGVDPEIIDHVAKKMGKKIAVKDVEFDVIIDNVSKGKIADAAAAGLTITDARKAKVDFSVPYYTSVQYVIFRKDKKPTKREDYVLWKEIAGGALGSQTGGTGYIFASTEVESGVLKYTGTTVKGFESHQLAADAVAAGVIDFALVDELPAKMIASKNSDLAALPLYYEGKNGEKDYRTEESYAIAVNKDHPELLEAVNSVLEELMKKDESGQSEIDRLVLKYTGF